MKTSWLSLTAVLPLFLAVSCMNTPAEKTPTGGMDDLGPGFDFGGRTAKQHRPVATACEMTRAPGPAATGSGTCKKDSDCVDATLGKNGRCVVATRFGTTTCTYDECFDDSTCTGKVCLCRPAGETMATTKVHHCLSAGNCRSDGDCGAGGSCSPSFSTCGSYTGVVAYYCHTPQDSCLDDEDCASSDGGVGVPGYCMFSPEGAKWICGYGQCVG